MPVLRVPIANRFAAVAAMLLGAAACGSPADNGALFSASSAGSLSAGGSPAGSTAGNASGGASASSDSGTSGSSSALGGATVGSGGDQPSAAAPNVGGPGGGGPGSGGPEGGGAPNAGGPNGVAGAPVGGGSTLTDCSAFGNGASYYSETKHCYLAVHDLATFADAQTHCISLGAHLVTLSNQQENDFVWNLDAVEHWIGATDGKGLEDMTPGTYAWVDGEPFTYTDWSVGQPNATASTCPAGTAGDDVCYEHCAFQWTGGAAPGEWNDRLCTHTIDAICEWDG